jgi:hypothetical protein
MAYTADVYDTPSGHLDGDYVLATGSSTIDSTLHVAHVIGTQSWTVCHNPQGQKFEFRMAPADYGKLSSQGAVIPDRDPLISTLQ